MAELFASGRIVDVALALVALEAAALLAWRWRRSRGPSSLALIGNLASGAFLMLAVRAALTDADWTIVAACLLGALLAHLADLRLRLREAGATSLGRSRDVVTTGTSTETAAFTARRQVGMIS